MNLRDNASIPALPGWISLKEAADELGFTRQYIFRLASNGGLQTVHRVGTQPMFVVSQDEIDRLKTVRAAAHPEEVPTP